MCDNFNVNLRKNEGFLTYIPCIPIQEYGQSNAPLDLTFKIIILECRLVSIVHIFYNYVLYLVIDLTCLHDDMLTSGVALYDK